MARIRPVLIGHDAVLIRAWQDGRTYCALNDAGMGELPEAVAAGHDRVVGILDSTGYARSDERTVNRMKALEGILLSGFPDGIDARGRSRR